MHLKMPPREVDRRKFMNGRWAGRPASEGDRFEVASILVQARPERLDAAVRTIETMPGAQIFSRDPKGKLVVVVEAEDVGRIGEALNAISLMPDVLTAALVFHRTDENT
jgi:nitrate reductase NapD